MAHPQQLPLISDIAQSFILDNGAFSLWKTGKTLDVAQFVDFVAEWEKHPGFDWALMPDAIDGDHHENAKMRAKWFAFGGRGGVPVWHMHEPLEVLRDLANAYPRIAFGSSGQFSSVGTAQWWSRMSEAMAVACDEQGRPITKIHGLRMLAPTVFSHVPLASADSCNVAMNVGLDSNWVGPYQPLTKSMRALVLADRIEHHACAVRWSGSCGVQQNMELVG